MPDVPDQMRVLMVAPQPFYRDRGTPIALRQVLRALSELGHRVDLLTFPLGENVDLPGLDIRRTGRWLPVSDVPIGLSAGKLLLDTSLTLAVARRLIDCRYDVIHAVEEAAFPCAALSRWSRTPLVYDMQSSLPEQLERHTVLGRPSVQPKLKAAEAWLLRRSSVVACSAGLADHVRSIAPDAEVREWWFAPEPGSVSTEEVVALRRELRISDDAKVILYTGNFAPYQGVSMLLEAAIEVSRAHPDAVFVLVGGSPDEAPEVSDVLDSLRTSGAVRVVGRQPRERMPVYVAAADVLVSPRAHGGNLPLKIFDYLDAGKPIVATDIPTHRALLDENRAFLVPMSAQDMAGSISMILRDADSAQRIGRAARQWSERHLGWESFRDRVSSLYHAAVGRFDNPSSTRSESRQ